MHALRVKGAATSDDVERLTGLGGVDQVLEALASDGLVTSRGTATSTYHALSEAGLDRHRSATRQRLTAEQLRRIAEVYDGSFLKVNVQFKRLCAEWQHDERFELVEEAVGIHDEITTILALAAEEEPRLARYAERFEVLIDAFQEGESAALAAPVGESYHNVWFELHEDLLVTLGRSRADEAA